MVNNYININKMNKSPLISTHWTLNKITLNGGEIRVLGCECHKNVAGLNRLFIPLTLHDGIFTELYSDVIMQLHVGSSTKL
jgi:hypothetical protein